MTQSFVYILASGRNGTLYRGHKRPNVRRVGEHKKRQVDGFTKKYKVDQLVYFERHEAMRSANTREKQIKKWNRAWKVRLIEEENPHWRDFWADLI